MFWFNFAGSVLIPGTTPMQYIGEDDSRLDDEITVEEYMKLSEEEKKVWAIVSPNDIEDYDDLEFALENCSIEPFEEEQQGL